MDEVASVLLFKTKNVAHLLFCKHVLALADPQSQPNTVALANMFIW
jgi:hypothetical protein